MSPIGVSLPPKLSSAVQSLLRRCLQKEARQRLPDIAQARLTLEDALAEVRPATARTKRIPSWLGGSAVAILAAGLAAFVAWNYRPSLPVTESSATASSVPLLSPDPATGLNFMLPPGQQIGRTLQGAIAISPDGASVVYVSNDRLHLHGTSGTQSSPIPGTAGALNPVFSPDGQWLAFWMFRSQPEEDRSPRWRTDSFNAIACCPFEPELGRRYAGVRRYQRNFCDS